MSRYGHSKTTVGNPGPPLSPLPSVAVPPPAAISRLLALVLAVYLVAGVIHAYLVPIGQSGYQNAPDEAAHVNYVRTLASGHLPTQHDEAAGPNHYEWHQPPLYYAIDAIALGRGVRAMRLVSLLLGMGCILVIYRLALLLFPEDPQVALLAASIAALTPGHIAITSTVNNDVLLELLFSTTLLVLIVSLRSGYTLWRAGWLGLVVGAALLTKSTALLLIPTVAVALLIIRRGGESTPAVLRGALWTALISLMVCGWWYARNGIIYHEWLPLREFEASFRGTVQARDIVSGRVRMLPPVSSWGDYWILVSRMSFQSFWAVFGTPTSARVGAPVFLPDPIYQLIALVTVTVGAGMVRLHLRRKTVFTETQIRAVSLLFLTIGMVAAAFAAFLTHYFQTQGRYLYPAMAGLCIVMALGWRSAFPERYRALASFALVIVMGITSAIFLIAVQAAVSP